MGSTMSLRYCHKKRYQRGAQRPLCQSLFLTERFLKRTKRRRRRSSQSRLLLNLTLREAVMRLKDLLNRLQKNPPCLSPFWAKKILKRKERKRRKSNQKHSQNLRLLLNLTLRDAVMRLKD